MASVSYNYYVGNGVKKDYEFTQELNSQATVYGLVNQIETAGTWDSGTGFFTFTVAPASGADIWIARRTSNDTAVATYPNKSYIRSENLDADFRQSLMQVQEAQFDNDQAVLLNAGAPGYAAAAAASAAAALVSENAAAADLVLTNADVVSTNADVVSTNADVVSAGLEVTYAEEWATKAEDSLISVAAGGDGATDYSALHWAAKSAADASTAVQKTGDTMTGALTLLNGSNIYLQASGSPQYPIYVMKDSAGTDRFRMQYNHDGTDTTSFIKLSAAGAIQNTFALKSDGNCTISAATPTAASHVARKDYVDTMLPLAGSTMESAADITFAGGGEVLGLPATPSATGASSKEYTDTEVGTKQTDVKDVVSMEINQNGSGDRNAFIDFHASDDAGQTDFSARFIRASGANGEVQLVNKGSGSIKLLPAGATVSVEIESTGNVAISATAPTDVDHLTRKDYVDTMLPLAGGTLSGTLTIGDGNDLTVTGEVTASTHVTGAEVANTGTTPTVDWGANQAQKVTMTTATAISFTNPAGPGKFVLKLVNGGTGVITWDSTVKWAGGSEPSWTVSGTDIIEFYHDGTNYYATVTELAFT